MAQAAEAEAGAAVEKVGLLLVHGMGEQKPFDHLRLTAKDLASAIASTPGLIRLSVAEDLETAKAVTIDAAFGTGDEDARRVRFELREVYWADLGAGGSLIDHAKFWFWGLGQWGAEAVLKGNPLRNTVKLMTNPRFAHQPDPTARPGFFRQLPSRAMLFGAALLAILTFFTWSAAKRVVAFLAGRLPSSSLIFLFLGDVKTYQQSGAAGKGSLLDPDLPVRTTIRRRMVAGMTAMAAHGGHDRWYILAHSLGTVPAFNMLQEVELTLPNYLSEAEWLALPERFKTRNPFKPEGAKPTTDAMMPRRPPWLEDADGIDRVRLFERFAGFVTYGCPLDKFAALWPRIAVLNRQTAVFREECDWVNLHDPTDPVSAKLDAFAPPGNRADEDSEWHKALVPLSFASRSSLIFGLSHIRYLRPRRKPAGTMPVALAGALASGSRLKDAAAAAAMGPAAAWARALAALIQLLVLAAALLVAAAAVLLAIGKALPDRATAAIAALLERLCPQLLAMLQEGLPSSLIAAALIVLAAALALVLGSGIARAVLDALKSWKKI